MADRVFEDDFMDVQTGLVSLVLEATADLSGVTRIYIFGAIERSMTSFNAFVELDGSFRRLDAVCSRDILMQVLGLGASDLARLAELCAANGQTCPTQIYGRYDVRSDAFDVRYEYELVASREVDPVTPGESFSAWLDAVQAGSDGFA